MSQRTPCPAPPTTHFTVNPKFCYQLIFCSTAAASDTSQEDDLEREDIGNIQEDFERVEDEDRERISDRKLEEGNEITENEEEEMSAL